MSDKDRADMLAVACDDLIDQRDTLRAELEQARAEAERYRATLVRIDDDCGPCEIVIPGSPDPCPAEYRGDQDMWCVGCLARAALSKDADGE